MKPETVRRIVEPIVLGSLSNIFVNWLFNPERPDFIVEEFVVAILLSIPLTESNRHIGSWLDQKYGWLESFKKRLLTHLLFLLIVVLLVLNIVGNLYILIKGDSFYSWQELLVINCTAFLVASFLTFFSWTSFYYKQWKSAQHSLQLSQEEIRGYEDQVSQANMAIRCTKGKRELNLPADTLLQAEILNGVTRLFFLDGTTALFQGSLNDLELLLPSGPFFRAKRNLIIHRNQIASNSSATYGKIDVEVRAPLSEEINTITISRKKAATFRKWLHAQ